LIYPLNDSNKAIAISRKTRVLVEEKYSIDKVVDDLEEPHGSCIVEVLST
jgi:hypothetical protein